MDALDKYSIQVDMPSSYQGVINNALEEGHLEIALETIGLFLSPDYVPSPAHTLILLYLALHPTMSDLFYINQSNSSSSSSSSRAVNIHLPSVNKLSLPDTALSQLHRLLELHSPVPLARSIPSFDPPSIYWNRAEPDMAEIEKEARGMIDWKNGLWNGWRDHGESWGKLKSRTNGNKKRSRRGQQSEEGEGEGRVTEEKEESERVERWWLVLDWLCILWTKDLVEVWTQSKEDEEKAFREGNAPPGSQQQRIPLLLAQIPPETNSSTKKIRWNLSHILPLVQVLYSNGSNDRNEFDELILNRSERRKRTLGSLISLIIILTYPVFSYSQPFLSPVRVHTQISEILSMLPPSSLPRFLAFIHPSLQSSLARSSAIPNIEPFKTQLTLSLLINSDPVFPPATLTPSKLQETLSKADLSGGPIVLDAAIWLVSNVAGRSSIEQGEHRRTKEVDTSDWRTSLGESLESVLDRAGEETEKQAVGEVGRTWVKALKG